MGAYDPTTLELKPHDPELFSTMQIPVEWNADAECELVDGFLQEVLPEDCIELVGMMLGYLLTPDITADKFFVMVGPAGTGKTTFLSMVHAMIGQTNTALVSLQDLAGNRFAMAALEGKLLCVFDDLDATPLKSASTPKVLTGGFSNIRVERKCKDAYEAPLYARMLFTANEMPVCPDKSGAWLRRLCLLPFAKKPERKDPDLADKLKTPEGLQRLFVLAVMGLQALIAGSMDFPAPESSQALMADYRVQNDSVVAFIQECCEVHEERWVDRAVWYERYSQWCRESNRQPVGRSKGYKRLMNVAGIIQGKDAEGTRLLKGIGLAVGGGTAALRQVYGSFSEGAKG